MRTLRIALLLLLAGPAAVSRADTVVLAGGSRLEGVVLEKGDAGVRLLLPEGSEISLAAADVKEVLPDADAPPPGKYMRWHEAKEGPKGLQVALVHFVCPDGRRVDLVSAVHIADAAFFREVTKILEQEDLVLYEMVKPEGADPEAVPEVENPIRRVQKLLGTWLGLAFQLDHIDYHRPHFVHADMTVEEFKATGPGAGFLGADGGMGPMFKAAELLLEGRGAEDADPEKAAKARAGLKAMFGRLLGSLGPNTGALLGGALSDLVIVKRNQVVVEKLKALAPEARHVAVFYGAGHFKDMEERLEKELGYRRAGARWLTAWAVP